MKKQDSQPDNLTTAPGSDSACGVFLCKLPGTLCGCSKSPEQLKRMICSLLEEQDAVLATEVDDTAGSWLVTAFPEGEYDPTARVFLIRPQKMRMAKILIAASGRADLPAALEAKYALCACGLESRILLQDFCCADTFPVLQTQLAEAAVCIAVAGANPALPGIAASMSSVPVIALPVSVSRSNSLNGIFSMLGNISSSANGVLTVGCDNASGAGFAAARIINAAMLK